MKKPKVGPKVAPTKEWPAAKVEMRSLADIKPYPRNARTHPAAQIKMLAQIMTEQGVDQPIVVDEDGIILKGHGRREAAKLAGFDVFPVVVHRGLTDAVKMAMRIQDNTIPLLSGWDEGLIKLEIGDLTLGGYDVQLLGFDAPTLAAFTGGAASDGIERGNLLDLVKVTIADPKHVVEAGSLYLLDGRHHLFCGSVVEDWPTWGALLKDGALFAPYPGVFVPFSTKAKTHAFVMVQPDPYIAGHILDRFEDAFGKKSIRQVTP